MRARHLIIPIILAAHSLTYAADIISDAGRTSSINKEQSESMRTSVESKISATKSKSSDRTNSQSSRNSRSRNRDSKLDLSLSFRALLPEDVSYLQAVDLGLAVRVENGWINATANEWFDQAKKSSAYINDFSDEAPIRDYIHALARFGARAGQAQILLNTYFAKLGAIKKKGGKIEVISLGADDLAPLAVQAWLEASEITDRRIKSKLSEILEDKTPCRFSTDDEVLCGKSTLKLSVPPVLRCVGIVWYSSDQFAGLTGNYSVSSSWSLSDAFERSSGVSSSARKEVLDLRAKGKAVEAVDSQRRALSNDRGSKASMSPSKFIQH